MKVSCAIAGGGPAGMMLGFLLARAGISVVVLEKHKDFLRDFRGDTIHPATLQLMYEMGLLDDFLQRPHQEVTRLAAVFGPNVMPLGDFTHVPTHCKFLALMPQWDFLDFLVQHGRRYPPFNVMMEAKVTGLKWSGDRVAGVLVSTPQGDTTIDADLVVGADGRHSTVRPCARLTSIARGAPIDVLWMRLSRETSDPRQAFGFVGRASLLVLIDRDSYWQCGYVIPKGAFDDIRSRGLTAFQRDIASAAPFLADRVRELDSWDEVSLLTVQIDMLERWHRDGLICIGDAAHAMSPVGGVGINLAIQDAVATANMVHRELAGGPVREETLAAVQRRRTFPTRVIQNIQVFVQNRVITSVLRGTSGRDPSVPFALKLFSAIPLLQRIPAWLVGVGVRPEHVGTPEAA